MLYLVKCDDVDYYVEADNFADAVSVLIEDRCRKYADEPDCGGWADGDGVDMIESVALLSNEPVIRAESTEAKP